MSEWANFHAIKVNASVAGSIYLPLMFHPMPVYRVFNLCKRYLRRFILLLIIGSVDSKNRKAITKGGNIGIGNGGWYSKWEKFRGLKGSV